MSIEEKRQYLINDIKTERYNNWKELIKLIEIAEEEKINLLYGYITTLEKVFEKNRGIFNGEINS